MTVTVTHSELFGYLSVASWLCAQLPQCYKNQKYKTTEGLSVEFILTWLAGDILNVVGCLFTHQLRFQLVLAIWFVLIDVLLTGQYIAFRETEHDERGRPTTRMVSHRQTVSLSVNRIASRSRNDVGNNHTHNHTTNVHPSVTVKRSRRSQTHSIPRAGGTSGRNRSLASLVILGLTLGVGAAPTVSPPLLHPLVSDDLAVVMGKLSSWACVTFYLSSRMPQIYYNYQRKSIEGLSVFLFLFALLGNTFYTLSILTSPRLYQSHPLAMKYLLESLPFLIGSLGTITFDIIILLQVAMYSGTTAHKTSDERQPLLDTRSNN